MIPVVFIHGEPLFRHKDYGYVKVAVEQAKIHNENVVLLGADCNAHWPVHHFHQKDFREGMDFTRLPYYEHMSTNPERFEIAATSMPFLLRNWMRKEGVPKAMLCESDTMLYGDMTAYEQRFGDYLAAFDIPSNQPDYRWSASCHASFWTLEGIERLCTEIEWGYGTPKGHGTLQLKWKWHQESGARGGICIMTFLFLLAELTSIVNVTPIGEDNLTIDHNIRSAENWLPNEFRMARAHHPGYSGPMKELTWRDGIPHGWHLQREEPIGFAAIHFNSSAKVLMKDWRSPK